MEQNKLYKTTFHKRLSLIVAVTVLVVFAILFGINIYGAITDLNQKEKESSLAKVMLYTSKIEQEVSTIETEIRAHEIALRRNILSPDSIRMVLEDIMKDDRLQFSYVAFEPSWNNVGEAGRMFEVDRKDDGTVVFNKVEKEYKYRTYPFYIIPVRSKQDYWSYPYFENGKQVSSFVHPLIDKNGKVIGVIGADLNLNILTKNLASLKHIDEKSDAFISVLGNDGGYLVHNNEEMIANETYITDARTHNSPDLEDLGRKILSGESGSSVIYYDGVKEMVSYSHVNGVNWGVLMRIPYIEIYVSIMKGILFSILAMIICVVLLTALIRYVIKKGTRPITEYADAAMKIAKGDFDTPVNTQKTGDEIQYLGDSLNKMRVDLKDYVQELATTTASRQTLEKELLIAHDIQMSMLPRLFPCPPTHKHVDAYAYLKPAKAVGGDLYDFVVKDDILYFIIGDVSGKGIPASLIMAITSSVFRASNQINWSPKDIVENINNTIAPNNELNMFVTLIVGELNLFNGHLRFCNAGHDPMILAHEGKCDILSMYKNLPVGLMENYKYKMNEIDLFWNDKLVLFTDGIAEAENENKELYTIERLRSMVDTISGATPSVLVNTVIEDVKAYAGEAEQSDDITMMCIHFTRG